MPPERWEKLLLQVSAPRPSHLCGTKQVIWLRYTEETCNGGRGLHVLGEVAGRSTDFVVSPDGRMMHALAVIYVLRATEGVGRI